MALLFNKSKEPTIKLIDDFKDDRARDLVSKYELEINEILPQYASLQSKAQSYDKKFMKLQHHAMLFGNDSSLDIRLSNSEKQEYVKEFASGAVLCYEFTQRDIIRIPVKGKINFINNFAVIPKQHLNMEYEKIAKIYMTTIDLINNPK